MIILSLIFLAFVSMNIISNSMRAKRVEVYINNMEKELPEELNIINNKKIQP